MERAGQQIPLTQKYRTPTAHAQHFHILADVGELRRADEHHFHGSPLPIAGIDEAVYLTPIRVPPYGSIKKTEAFLFRIFDPRRQQDCAGTRTEHWHTFAGGVADGIAESVAIQEFQKRGALTAGDHQSFDLPDLPGVLH